MAKRLLDLVVSLSMLIVTSPLFVVAAIGIWLTSRGPIFYRANRIGRNGATFAMYKFRTMHLDQRGGSSVITVQDDPRIFGFGAWLRHLKIDELPQLFNVLKGDMSLVGPRPEDPLIVGTYYSREQLQTLTVTPGLASPGSIYNYTHGERLLCGDNPEQCYVELLLPVKLALDLVYVREVSLRYDLKIIFRAAWVILASFGGRRNFPDPSEMTEAMRMLH